MENFYQGNKSRTWNICLIVELALHGCVCVCVCLWRHAHNTHRYMGQVILLEWGGDFITVSSVLSCSPQEIRNYSRIFLDLGLLKWCGGNISLSWKKCIRCFFPGGGDGNLKCTIFTQQAIGPYTHLSLFISKTRKSYSEYQSLSTM